MKILMPLDGSDFSKSVFPVARRLLDVVDCVELHLLLVGDPKEAVGQYKQSVLSPLVVGDAVTGSVVLLPQPSVAESHGEVLDRQHLAATEWLENVATLELNHTATVHFDWSSRP